MLTSDQLAELETTHPALKALGESMRAAAEAALADRLTIPSPTRTAEAQDMARLAVALLEHPEIKEEIDAILDYHRNVNLQKFMVRKADPNDQMTTHPALKALGEAIQAAAENALADRLTIPNPTPKPTEDAPRE